MTDKNIFSEDRSGASFLVDRRYSSTPDFAALIGRGHEQANAKHYAEAEASFAAALSLEPNSAIALASIGWARQMQGDVEGAILNFRRALAIQGSFTQAQRNLATALSDAGRFDEAEPWWDLLVTANSSDLELLNEALNAALTAHRTEAAARYATFVAVARRGSRLFRYSGVNVQPPATPNPEPQLSKGKLRHDIEQFRYLARSGVLAREPTAVLAAYERVLEGMQTDGGGVRRPMNEAERSLIGDFYGRIIYVRPTPRVDGQALSQSWDHGAMEEKCLGHPLGIVVIDNFLSQSALESLRQFCLQSTIWFTNRHGHGRLGAFFREGFNCPLLVQIADELRAAFPRLVRDHRLEQIWGFKYENQPETHPHADFAAVNVNFWITPDEANLDKKSGGLVFYDREAPGDWDFEKFNRDGPAITAYLNENRARFTTIPYRANRAIIFRSDLFHGTAPVEFRTEYESRRINVTMLYGRRGSDDQ
jgi:hypothetical protein